MCLWERNTRTTLTNGLLCTRPMYPIRNSRLVMTHRSRSVISWSAACPDFVLSLPRRVPRPLYHTLSTVTSLSISSSVCWHRYSFFYWFLYWVILFIIHLGMLCEPFHYGLLFFFCEVWLNPFLLFLSLLGSGLRHLWVSIWVKHHLGQQHGYLHPLHLVLEYLYSLDVGQHALHHQVHHLGQQIFLLGDHHDQQDLV